MTPIYITKYGRLYHGDAMGIMPRLDLSRHALLTDPMYGEGQNLQRSRENKTCPTRVMNGLELKRKDWPASLIDQPPDDLSFILQFDQSIVWGGNYFADKLPASRCWIIWDKLHIPPDNHHDGEMAWTNLAGVTRIYRQLWRGVCRSGEENISNGPKLHPFQKPTRLINFCINQFKGNPPIIDPFAGSGTTPLVCERLGIQWIAIEKVSEMCEVIIDRLKKEQRQCKLPL